MFNKLASAAFAAALALAALAPSAHAQKALVYCPVGVDAAGCDRVVTALQSKFPDGVDRGYDGSAGTIDLSKADLNHYSVVVVPSLADNADKKPYAVLRSAAARLRLAINGRVAVYSGAPDQGSANREDKDALIQNLAGWAAKGHTRGTSLVGLVAFLDLSENEAERYAWVKDISLVDVSADAELRAFPEVSTVSPRGGKLLSNGGRALRFSNMASYGLHIGRGAAARTEVGATGGASGAQSVLVTYANADGPDLDEQSASTGKVGPGGASFSISSTGSPSLSTSVTTTGATLTTDKEDYSPGDTVLFTGTGFGANDSVTITLHEDPQWSNPDRTVNAVTDGNGNFSSHIFIVDQRDYGVTFTATAVGSPSGAVAQTMFTDGNKVNFSLTATGAEISTFGTLTPNQCQAAFAQERQGNSLDVAPAGGRLVTLTSTPSGAQFFAGASCAGSAITSVTIPALQSNVGFSFKVAAAGSYTLNGNGGFTGSNNASATLTISGVSATTTTLASSLNPSLFAQTVTFTATVSATSGTPTGTVTFKDNGGNLGTGTLSTTAGVTTATFTTSSLSVATHPITAEYAGVAGTFSASTSNTVSQVVNKAPSTTVVSCPLSLVYTGSPLTPCTATVTGAGGLNLPVTPVTYTNNTNAGAAGASATFTGDANHTGSTGTGGFTIDKASSTTTLTCPTSVTYTGSPLTPCTAAATGAGALNVAVTPVTYTNNTNAGVAGASATFAGDANHNGSTGSGAFTIDKASSTTTVSCPASVFYSGSPQTPCSVAVTGAGGLSATGTPTYSNNVLKGTATATYSYPGDANHLSSNGSNNFQIVNQAPVLVSVAGPPAPVPLGSAVTVTGNFTDPGAISDQFTFTSTWTGGPTPLTVTTGTVNSYNGNAGSFTITAPANIQSGVYTVKVTVTDRFGDSSNELTVLTYVVVFDPSGGFVTGGGWIDSPPGAYFDNPTLTGKANFGFVSKYKKGQSTPDGNTEFQFQTAGLNFKATSYEWLVIAGAKAQYKGSGTINGSGDYFFMLTATDGELKGKGVLDAFRIKIWRKDAAGTVVYDNLLNAPDSVDPTTFLGGGSIQIHDK